MLKSLFYLFFLTFLFSCNSDKLEKEVVSDINPVPTKELEPKNLRYSVANATYFQNTDISPNVALLDGEKESMAFTIEPSLPEGLFFNTADGSISGRASALMNQTFYTVRAKNTYGLISVTISLKIVIPPPIGLTYSTLSDITIYNYQQLDQNYSPNVSGIVSNYSIEPSLPSGVLFNTETGVISGRPEITDLNKLGKSITYIVKANNSSGFAANSFKIKVIDTPPINLRYNIVDSSYNVGIPVVRNYPIYEGGQVTLFVLDPVDLPAGLFFNSITGYIEGTPLSEVSTARNYRVIGYNTGGSVESNISIRVFSDPPISINYAINNARYTKDIVITPNTVTHTGGQPTVYSISPELPMGLIMNSNNGTISGTPVSLQASTNYYVQGTNTGGAVTKTIAIEIIDKAPVNLKYPLSNYKIRKNETFSIAPINNTGGAVTSYQVVPLLPAGLSFNTATGVLSGTPTVIAPSTNYTVTALNTGGSYSWVFNLEVKDVPLYDFNYKLVKKEYAGFNLTDYTFEIENISKESDGSVGINLSLPITLTTSNENITINNQITNNCLSLTTFTYLSKCNIKFSYLIEEPLPLELMVVIKASTVKSKNINFLNYLNIAPTNVILTADRNIIVKAIVDNTPKILDTTTEATCKGYAISTENPCTIETPIVGAGSIASSTTLNPQSFTTLIGQIVNMFDDFISPNNDPDANGVDGIKINNNILFTSTMLSIAQFSENYYNAKCEINIPFAAATTCRLGEFFLGSTNINYSGNFSVNIGSLEGVAEEKTRSNNIKLDVYKIKKISSLSKEYTLPKVHRLVTHNNKVYFSGIINNGSSQPQKLMSYNPALNKLSLVSNRYSSLSGSDVVYQEDSTFPFASYDGFLFLVMRSPGFDNVQLGTLLYYVFDESQNNIKPLYTGTTGDPAIGPLSATQTDDIFSFVHLNKLFFQGRAGVNNPQNQFLYSYDKTQNKLKKEAIPFNQVSHSDNNKIKADSVLLMNDKLFSSSFIPVTASTGGYKLNFLELKTSGQQEQRLLNKGTSPTTQNDYLDEPVALDNKIFYVTRSSDNETTSIPELIYYSDIDARFEKIFTATASGPGRILGIFYNKVFFIMPTAGSKNALYSYDLLDQEIKKVYETNASGRLFRLSKFANFENFQGVYLMELDPATNKRNILKVSQVQLDLEIDKIIDGRDIELTEDVSLFNYNNTLFFSCSSGLESLCAYNSAEKTVSLIANGLKLNVANTLQGKKTSNITLLNNRIYFIGDKFTNNEYPALFEMCLLTESGCAP